MRSDIHESMETTILYLTIDLSNSKIECLCGENFLAKLNHNTKSQDLKKTRLQLKMV